MCTVLVKKRLSPEDIFYFFVIDICAGAYRIDKIGQELDGHTRPWCLSSDFCCLHLLLKKSKSHLISNLNLAEETQGTQARTKWELINFANASFLEAFFKAVQNLICILKWGGERQQTFTPHLISFRRRNAPFLFLLLHNILFPHQAGAKVPSVCLFKIFPKEGFS